MLVEKSADGPFVVEGDDEGVGRVRLGHAGAIGETEGGLAGTGLGEQAVGVAVIAALELDDLVAAGEGAGQAEGGHCGLSAGVDEPHQFYGGDGLANGAGQLHLQLGGGAVGGAAPGGLGDGVGDGGMGVAEDEGAEGGDVVDVGVAVKVEDAGPLAVGDEGRVAADGLEGADGAGDAAGHVAASEVAQFAGAGSGRVAISHDREPARGAAR